MANFVDKNILKAQIRQKIQEKILAKGMKIEDPKYSIGGFFSNVKSDVGEVVRGVGAMLGLGGKAIMHPVETVKFVKSPQFKESMKQIGSEVVGEYKEYKQPLKKLYEDPLQVVTDALTIATLGGAGITKVGQVAKVAPLIKAGKAVSYVGKPITVTKDITKLGISKIPGGKEFLTALEQRGKAISLVSETQRQHIVERNKLLTEVEDTLKKLTPAEQQTLIPFAQKTVTLPFKPSADFEKGIDLIRKLSLQREEVIAKAGKLKPELIEARRWQPIIKNLGLDETTLPQAPKGLPEALKAEKGIIPQELQPLAQEARKYKSAEEFVKSQSQYQKLYRGGSIYQPLKITDQGVSLSYNKSVAEKFDKMAKMKGGTGKIQELFVDKKAKILDASKVTLKDVQQDGYEILGEVSITDYARKRGYDAIDFRGRSTYHGIMEDELKVINSKVIKDEFELTDFYTQAVKGVKEVIAPRKLTIAEQIAEAKKITGFTKDPIYVQHIFEDAPKKFTDFFVNTAPIRNWKPGFLKKSFGVKGYSVDAPSVLKWEAAQTLKFKNNIDLLDRVKNLDFVEPLDNIKNLKPGHKVFAPDGYIRFYQGTIDLSKEFAKAIRGKKSLKMVDDVWDNFKEAIDNAVLEKKYIGVTGKVKLYQVPDSVAGVLQGYAKATNPYIKLFFDKPVDAFRFLALALTPRWLVNNIVGNTMMSIIAGDPLSPAGYLTARKAQQLGVVPDDVFSGFYRTEKLMSGKLGRAAETKVGQIMAGVGERLAEAPIIKQIGKIGDLSYKINSITDDFFRTAHYINVATKEAKKKLVRETGQKLNNTIKLLEYAKQDPEIMAKAIKSVEEFFYGAGKLSPFERNVMRRFLPFYSWYKFITLYSVRLPLNHPKRFEVISNLAKAFYQITNQDQLPNYLKGSVPIGEAPDGSTYYLRTSGLNPFGLLEDLVTLGIEQTAFYSLTPLAKTIIERITARESFSGRTYTSKDVIENFGGRLYKVNPETGVVEEVEEKTKPALLEHLLRNFVPQYQMLEQGIVGGAQVYTAAGLPSLITGEAKKISPITGEPITKVGAQEKVILRGLGLLGLPISLRTGEQMQAEAEALQRATSQIFYDKYPMLSPQFKNQLKEEIKRKMMNKIHGKGIIEGLW